MHKSGITSLELCAGAGGQALGLEQAGFEHVALFENDKHACATLRLNRPQWNVLEHDLFSDFDFSKWRGIDLLAGGLPCPPFSVAGKQLGERDERNLFTRGVEIAEMVQPRAIMFENVKGMLDPVFDDYRHGITSRLRQNGYSVFWEKVSADSFGVSQLRPRVVMIALKSPWSKSLSLEFPRVVPKTVGELLRDLMGQNGWAGAEEWARKANRIAPTLVGGSKKHGGPDLGPSRARAAWAELGVEGRSLADDSPDAHFVGNPRLTVEMAALVQGFPRNWKFSGRKTAAYRQVGNAFPPPVAMAVGQRIAEALQMSSAELVAAE